MRETTPWTRTLFVVSTIAILARALLPGDRLGTHPDVERAADTRPTLQRRSEEIAVELDIERVTVYVWEADVPNLFVLGSAAHGHVVVSTAALEALTDGETVACIGHELAHVRNNHALTLGALLVAGVGLVAGTYAAVATRRCRRGGLAAGLLVAAGWGLLTLALTRDCERAADLAGGVATGHGRELASALVTVDSAGEADCEPDAYEPDERNLVQRLVATHPPVGERLDYLTAGHDENG